MSWAFQHFFKLFKSPGIDFWCPFCLSCHHAANYVSLQQTKLATSLQTKLILASLSFLFWISYPHFGVFVMSFHSFSHCFHSYAAAAAPFCLNAHIANELTWNCLMCIKKWATLSIYLVKIEMEYWLRPKRETKVGEKSEYLALEHQVDVCLTQNKYLFCSMFMLAWKVGRWSCC